MTGRFADFLSEHLRGDRVIWVVVFLLVLTSIVSVYSASATLAWRAGGDSLGVLFKHSAFLGVGMVAMWGVHRLGPPTQRCARSTPHSKRKGPARPKGIGPSASW